MDIGNLLIPRDIRNESLWLEKPFSKGQAWMDLFLLANTSDNHFVKRGIRVEVKAGEVGWSEEGLAERWGWSRTKTRNFLQLLSEDVDEKKKTPKRTPELGKKRHQKEHQITIRYSNVSQVITINNFNLFLNKRQQKEHQNFQKKDREKDTEYIGYNNIYNYSLVLKIKNIYSEVYKNNRGVEYFFTDTRRDEKAIGELLRIFVNNHNGVTDDNILLFFKDFFTRCLSIKDTWLFNNMCPHIIHSKLNTITNILNNGDKKSKPRTSSEDIARIIGNRFTAG